MSTRRRQREIPSERWQDSALTKVPLDVQATGMKLWGYVDDEGRAELRSDLIAAYVLPGRDGVQMVEDHLLVLSEASFLSLYPAEGTWWLQLHRPLKTPRPMPSECPSPPVQELSGRFLAVGGARVRERVEAGERAGAWAEWEQAQERTARPPARPLLLDAPPIGCPDHPNGRYDNCGPCGTARRRHDKWVAQQRYTEANDRYDAEHEAEEDDGEPF